MSQAHRAHASIVAAAKLRPSAMGLLIAEEVNALTTGLNDPKRPLMAIVGGSKVSTKLDLLNNLVKKVILFKGLWQINLPYLYFVNDIKKVPKFRYF